MAITTSMSKDSPKIESVFGPITAADDTAIREIFAKCDGLLIALARHFGHSRAGWEGTGLELTMYPSGQVEINCFVETCCDGDGDRCVSFGVELRPGWFYGEKTGERFWDVEAEIYADCQHKVYCGTMDLVYKIPVVKTMTPIDAAVALLRTVEELVQLAQQPLDTWLRLASDEYEA